MSLYLTILAELCCSLRLTKFVHLDNRDSGRVVGKQEVGPDPCRTFFDKSIPANGIVLRKDGLPAVDLLSELRVYFELSFSIASLCSGCDASAAGNPHVGLHAGSCPVGLGDRVHCPRKRHANHEMVVNHRWPRQLVFYDSSRTSNSILTSSLALTPAFPGGLIPKSVCFTMVSPV
jgi:hypothetical protein